VIIWGRDKALAALRAFNLRAAISYFNTGILSGLLFQQRYIKKEPTRSAMGQRRCTGTPGGSITAYTSVYQFNEYL
jgi:hypothetical protein